MSFGLSPLPILLGLAGLAGVLYLLQRLRVRHTEMPVVTTLFWKQAVEETRARVLVRRFRHWPAYLLFLAIGALLWLGFAQPTASSSADARHVLLLDGSAGMAWGARFQDARRQLLEDVGGLPADGTEVLLCGGTLRTLLAPGEDRLLLEKRLEGIAPEAVPSSLARALRSVGAVAGRQTTVHVYGDGPLELAGPALGDGIRVVRRDHAPARAGNVGIAALGIAEAASGRYDAVDVYAATRGGARLRLDLDGAPLGAPDAEGVWRDVSARGGRVTARVDAGDDLPLDDGAQIVLPDRPVLRVGITEDLVALFAPLIAADPGLTYVPEGEVDVLVEGLDGSSPAPKSLSVRRETPGGAVVVLREPTTDPGALVQAAFSDLLLAELDGAALARALGRPVVVTAEDAPMASIVIARDLLSAEAGFTDSRAFPAFVARALRRLAGRGAVAPYMAAGEPIDRGGRWQAPGGGARLDTIGVPLTPARVGDYTARDDGRVVHASLLPARLTSEETGDADEGDVEGGGWPPALWFVLLAFALLLLEWFLVRTGRVP